MTESTLMRRSRALVALAAAALACTSLVVVAPASQAAPARYAYSSAYNTMSACQAAQRSMGHSSAIRITKSCYSYKFNCYGIQCQIAYAFEWEYRKTGK